VVAAIDRLPSAGDRDTLASFLADRARSLRTEPAYLGWPAWSLAREEARKALGSWEAGRSR
jgi:hypothetical protein